MRTFKDSAGSEWKLHLTVGALKRIKTAGVDLCAMLEGNPPLMVRLQDDGVLLADVVWSWIEPQTKDSAVTRDKFDLALDSACIGALHKAFWEELSDFFQSLNPRVTRTIAATLGAGEQGDTAPAESGSESPKSPAPSASTPTPSASAN
jgi:hypothetical protein